MAARLTRRFWIALPFVVLLVLTGVALLFLSVASAFARGDYDAAQYGDSEKSYAVQRTVTTWWPEPWKATFNEGTAQLAQDEFFVARRTLEAALEQVPPAPPAPDGPEGALDPNSFECMVRTNLSLAIEGEAVEARAAKNRAEAVAFYNEALDMIAPCTSDGESESDEEEESEDQDQDQDQSDSQSSQDQIEERQQNQRDETRQEEQESQGNGNGSGQGQGEDEEDDQGGGGGGQQQPEDPRIEELEERNQEANEQGGQSGGGGGFGGGQNW